jgi:hypothetical protein
MRMSRVNPVLAEATMQYVCESGGKTWFRFETVQEAAQESVLMQHAVEKYFKQAFEEAQKAYVPPAGARYTEQNIGLKDHVKRTMPLFLTLRDREGNGLVTAMLPPEGKDRAGFRPILVGPDNTDPYVEHTEAIAVLGAHYKLTLDRARCFPYRR